MRPDANRVLKPHAMPNSFKSEKNEDAPSSAPIAGKRRAVSARADDDTAMATTIKRLRRVRLVRHAAVKQGPITVAPCFLSRFIAETRKEPALSLESPNYSSQSRLSTGEGCFPWIPPSRGVKIDHGREMGHAFWLLHPKNVCPLASTLPFPSRTTSDSGQCTLSYFREFSHACESSA